MSPEERRPADLQAAARLLGKRLLALSHAQYLYNGQVLTDECGDLQFDCDDGSQVSLFLLSDGESVGASSGPMQVPDAFELQEGVSCAWEARDLLQHLGAPYLRGAVMIQVQGLFDRCPERGWTLLCGFRIGFDSGDFLVFYNRGDEACALFNCQPPPVEHLDSQWCDVS